MHGASLKTERKVKIMKNATKTTKTATAKECKHCIELQAKIDEMTKKKEGFTVKPSENDKPHSNFYVAAVAHGLVTEGEARTFENKKAFNAALNDALNNPEIVRNVITVYAKKGWNIEQYKQRLEVLKVEIKELKAQKKEINAQIATRNTEQHSCRNIIRASKKMSQEVFSDYLAQFANWFHIFRNRGASPYLQEMVTLVLMMENQKSVLGMQ